MKKYTYILLIIGVIIIASCKAKKCPRFDGDGTDHHVKYNKGGLVKKKGNSPSRTWDTY
ncbi:MAG: hypothetical protein WCO54_11930 [Bacteroidota bacterium]